VFRDALLVAGKDLRVEARSRVATNQILPFALLVLFLFAFALDPNRGVLERATAGLFWLAVLFCVVLGVERAFALESGDGVIDALRLSGIDPAGLFLGKAGALFVQLVVLEVVLGLGVFFLYGAEPHSLALLLVAGLLATAGLAAAGTLYGALSAGLRVRETLLPLLFLPAVVPVLIGATRAYEAALADQSAEGWPWCNLLAVFAAVYVGSGVLAFGPLMEET
jgi:heme exporter protein B